MISGLIDIATKIKPASAAAPPPTMEKKELHCSDIGESERFPGDFWPERLESTTRRGATVLAAAQKTANHNMILSDHPVSHCGTDAYGGSLSA
jgi:hypothetical protein